MTPYLYPFIDLNISNPDSESISRKEQIDISVSLFDISASGYFGKIDTNYTLTSQVVTIPEVTAETTSSYYTPIYTEKLNYDEWLTRVNKNFQELE